MHREMFKNLEQEGMRWRALMFAVLLGGLGVLAWQAREPEDAQPPLSVVEVAAGVPKPGPQAVRQEDGLVWEDLVVGTGRSPSRQAIAVFAYKAWTADGRDLGSATLEEPLAFTVGTGETVAGFEKGIADMREGGRRRLWIPADLAYSQQGAPGVAPGTDLVFDLTLIDAEGEQEGPFPKDRRTVEP